MASPTDSYKDLTSPTAFTFPSVNARPENNGGSSTYTYNNYPPSIYNPSQGYPNHSQSPYTQQHPSSSSLTPEHHPFPSYRPGQRTDSSSLGNGGGGYGYAGGYPDTTSGLFTPLPNHRGGSLSGVGGVGSQGDDRIVARGEEGQQYGRVDDTGQGPGGQNGRWVGIGHGGPQMDQNGYQAQPGPGPTGMEPSRQPRNPPHLPFISGQLNIQGSHSQAVSPEAIAAAVMNRGGNGRSSSRSPEVYSNPNFNNTTHGSSSLGLGGLSLSQLGLGMGGVPPTLQGMSREQQIQVLQQVQYQQAQMGSFGLGMAGFGMGQGQVQMQGQAPLLRPYPQQLGMGMDGVNGGYGGIGGERQYPGPMPSLPGTLGEYNQASTQLPSIASASSGTIGTGHGRDQSTSMRNDLGPDESGPNELYGPRGSTLERQISHAQSGGGGSISAMSETAQYSRAGKVRGGSGVGIGTGTGILMGSSEYGDNEDGGRSERGNGSGHRKEGNKEGEDRDEDVTTIFIIGLPDDLSEREFVNLFTFAQGFEAAMLKVPVGTRPTSFQAGSSAANGNIDDPGSASSANEQIGGGALSKVRSTESADEGSLNPGSSSTSQVDGFSAPNPLVRTTSGLISTVKRGGILGFARFKTKADALLARDVLQGKRVDPMSTSGLKVEMAKKNLHAKRSIGNEELVGMLVRSGKLPGILAGMGLTGTQLSPSSAGPATVYGSRSGTPAATKAGAKPSGPGNIDLEASGRQRSWRNNIADRSSSAETSTERRRAKTYPGQLIGSARSFQAAGLNRRDLDAEVAAVGPGLSKSIDSKALLALAEEADGSEDWNVMGRGMDNLGAFDNESRMPSPYPQIGDTSWPAQATLANFGRQGNMQSANLRQVDSYSRYVPTDEGRMDSGIGPLNMADQNPPINTLYVGNLPPHEAFLEDALRALFCLAPGFRRMSFRQKVNGPMCFVEFEDIPLATQAMKELYAHTLGGMVKGGLRLAYSRNPLGQRGGIGTGAGAPRRMDGLAPLAGYSGMQPYRPSGLVNIATNSGSLGGQASLPSTSPPSDNPFRSARRLSEQSIGLSPHATPFSSSLSHHLAMSPSSNVSGLHDMASPSSPRGLAMTPWVSSGGDGSVPGGMATFASMSGSLGRKSQDSIAGLESTQASKPIFPSTNFGDMD